MIHSHDSITMSIVVAAGALTTPPGSIDLSWPSVLKMGPGAVVMALLIYHLVWYIPKRDKADRDTAAKRDEVERAARTRDQELRHEQNGTLQKIVIQFERQDEKLTGRLDNIEEKMNAILNLPIKGKG